MSPTMPTWRVLRSQQDTARRNARQALLVIQERRRAQETAERALPLRDGLGGVVVVGVARDADSRRPWVHVGHRQTLGAATGTPTDRSGPLPGQPS